MISLIGLRNKGFPPRSPIVSSKAVVYLNQYSFGQKFEGVTGEFKGALSSRLQFISRSALYS